MQDDPTSAAAAIAGALVQAKIPFAVGGALCLAHWGVVRATKDLDLNVFVSDEQLDPVFDALERGGCDVDRAVSIARARERGDVVATWHGMRVDVFVAFHAYHDEVRARVVQGSLPDGMAVPFLSAEDLAVFKSLFHRPKDLGDLHRLFAARAESFDIAYVRRWLDELLGPDDPRVTDIPRRFERIIARQEP